MKRLAAFCITVLIVGSGGWLVSSLSDASGFARSQESGRQPLRFVQTISLPNVSAASPPRSTKSHRPASGATFQVEYVLLVVRGACAAETIGTVLPLINSIYCLSARRSVWSVSFLAKDREA